MTCPAWTERGCTFPACGAEPVKIGTPDDEMRVVDFAPCEIDDFNSGRHMWHPGAYEGAMPPQISAS